MNHLNDEQLTAAYYGEFDAALHLNSCPECRSRYERLRGILDSFNQYPIPFRDANHGTEMWRRVSANLPPYKPRRPFRWWTLVPVLAALLVIAFMAGRMSRSTSSGISKTARERVLLMSLSDHLERSQIVLTNVANSSSGNADLSAERDRAHELLGANRLLRQTAEQLGDTADAVLLEELERVLLDVANSPDLEHTQQQMEQDGLLFKVRVTSVASRERGEKL